MKLPGEYCACCPLSFFPPSVFWGVGGGRVRTKGQKGREVAREANDF